MLIPKSSVKMRGTTFEIDIAAKQLRKTSTPAEKMLWQALRRGSLTGLKFCRQHPVGNFILDFYYPAHKLVIEVDGEIHHNQTDYDADRTVQLESHGYTVLRFQNEEVMHQLETVLDQTTQAIAILSLNPNTKNLADQNK
jgi:very-short-patch-repair endonuclease